jgi:uncharacterized repeat protein (TIGR03803 family)
MKIIQHCILLSVVVASACAASTAKAQYTFATLATFNDFTTGGNPYAGLIIDSAGDLYGTTYDGGVSGYGTVFKVANDANHTLSTLVSFDYFTNGADPEAGLIADAAGNLYGTTSVGGVHGVGTVFKMANDANHTLSILASFNGTNGSVPNAGLIVDAAGNLYGTTEQGGDLTLNGGAGYGTVFKVANDANHTLSTLATFKSTNGYYPEAGLIADRAGNLFGTTEYGGASGDGTVFEVANDASHTLSTLFSFNGTNGAGPTAGLITDTIGNLYGTTYTNGNITLRTDTVYFGGGTVFELSPVPEPASLVLGLVALGGALLFLLLSRSRQHAT